MVKKTRAIIAFLIVLSLLQIVVAQEETPTALEIKLPKFVNSHTVDIPITAPPGSKLEFYVDGVLTRVINSVSQNGIVNLYDVTLANEENILKVNATDSQGGVYEQEITVKVDTSPPVLKIDLSEASTQSKVTLKGKVSEEVDLKVKIYRNETDVEEKNLTANGDFTVDLELPVEKTTKIEVIATDKAGNTAQETTRTIVDTKPPQFLSDNLAQLTPSYDRIVTVRGKVSEKSQINIYINDELEKAGVLTDENGNFQQEIELKRSAKVQKSPGQKTVEAELPSEWLNVIKLEAVDLAGRKESKTSEIKYSLCGSGGDFRINWEKPSPSTLNPRLMLQGIQTFGIPFNISYTGGFDFSFAGKPTVYAMQLSPAESEKFDEEWVKINPPLTEISKNDVIGYVQVQFASLKDIVGQKKDTDYAREKNISDHRKGKECKVPGFGCVRFYLMSEVTYSQNIPRVVFDPNTNQRIENIDVEPPKTQKFCTKVEVSIDSVRPEFNLPSKRLQSTIEKVQTVIDTINGLLKPLNNVGQGLFYGCIGSTFVSTGLQMYETYSCEGSWISKLKGGAFNVDVAKAGLCDAVYSKDNDDAKKKNEACNTCQSAISKNRKFEYKVVRPICERVAGVSAPTLQNYLRFVKDDVRPLDVQLLSGATAGTVNPADFEIGGKLFVGSDCALKENLFGNGPSVAGIDRVRQIYTDSKNPALTKKCDELVRPASPDCCGKEYTKEWGETCGVASLGFDTFDELKESACLAEQKEGSNTLPAVSGQTGGAQCNKLWNAVAGFCDKNGQPVPEQIPTGVRLESTKAADLRARDNMIYLVVIPKGITVTGGDITNYEIKVSYVADTAELSALPASNIAKSNPTNSIDANVKTKFMFFHNGRDISDIFFSGGKLKTEKEIDDGVATSLRNLVCSDAGQGANCDSLTVPKVQELLKSVRNIVGTPDKEYIIQPDANLLTSVRCVYIPGITGWLNRWKQILTHANNCFKTIQTTGDGSPGVCQEFISVYVCDFIFDMARCFTQKYSEGEGVGGAFSLGGGGIGDVLHAITKGTTVAQQRMRARYGETAMFKQLFVERKLQHAMCAAAFGMPYDLDVESIYKQTIPEIPIPSQAMLFPCKRRFAGYNPVTVSGQKGLTTWIYETTAFIAPGSDLRWWLELKCSTGYKCEAKDGFKNGECDCNKLGQEKTLIVKPQEIDKDTLLKDEILDQKLSYVVQSSDVLGNSKVRYDRATLHWESSDPQVKNEMKTGKAECYIPLTGGDAPAFCSFDPIAGSYLCKFGQQLGSIDIDAKENAPTYYTGQTPSFTVTINQNYPVEIRNKLEENKYLSWKLKNEVGTEVDGGYLREQLATDGTYTKQVSPTKAIDRNLFATQPVGNQFSVTDSNGRIIQGINLRNAIADVKFTSSGVVQTTPKTATLEFYKENGVIHFKLDRLPVETPELRDGTYTLTITDYVLSGSSSDNKVVLTIINSNLISAYVNQHGTLKVTINNDAPQPVDPCASPKPWQMIFRVLDAEKTGEPSTRVSINPKNGQLVEDPVSFYASCGTPPAQTTTTSPQNCVMTVNKIIAGQTCRILDAGIFSDGVEKDNKDECLSYCKSQKTNGVNSCEWHENNKKCYARYGGCDMLDATPAAIANVNPWATLIKDCVDVPTSPIVVTSSASNPVDEALTILRDLQMQHASDWYLSFGTYGYYVSEGKLYSPNEIELNKNTQNIKEILKKIQTFAKDKTAQVYYAKWGGMRQDYLTDADKQVLKRFLAIDLS